MIRTVAELTVETRSASSLVPAESGEVRDMRYEPAFEVVVVARLRVAGRPMTPPPGNRAVWVEEVERAFLGDAEREVADLRHRVERALRRELDS